MTSTHTATSDGPDPSVYLLDRDTFASARLTYQHWILKLRNGWLLRPTINDAISQRSQANSGGKIAPLPLRIADVAAGNCIWSIEISSELPTAEVTAFDVSEKSYPLESTRPDSLHCDTWNFFDPLPEKYISYFDIVHIRFVVTLMVNGGVETVLKALTTMVKPGGWIQWQDAPTPAMDYVDSTTLRRPPDAECSQAAVVKNRLFGMDRGSAWIHKLDSLLRDVGGCQEVELLHVPFKRETLKYETDMMPWTFREMLNEPLKIEAEVDEQLREQLDRLATEVEREMMLVSKGEKVWAYSLVVAVGRKPA